MASLDLDSIFDGYKLQSPQQNPMVPLLAEYNNSLTMADKITNQSCGELITNPPSPLRGVPNTRTSPVSGPARDRFYCDSRLKDIDFGYWTTVPVSDDFAASLISLFLENEYGIVAIFDVETFLTDIVARRFDFCSSFLVNSLLCLASVSLIFPKSPCRTIS
jgi:hypothetical protein